MRKKTLLWLGGAALAYWWFTKQTPAAIPAPAAAPATGNSGPVAPA